MEVKQPKEQETKQYIEHNKHEELEARLNAQYKNKSVKGEDGLNWYVKHIKVINAKEVEITLTDLTKEAQIIKPIDELDKIF
nr:hypothetical protein [uncultured bacterium]AUH21240.1 hypothetical protein [uncultured bacterium]